MTNSRNKKRLGCLSRRVLVFLLAAVLTVWIPGLSGCGSSRETDIRYLIGVSLANTREQWRVRLKEELEEQASRYPNVRLIFTDAADNEHRQQEDVQKLLGYGVDLMMVSPIDTEEMTPLISEVYQEIPVFVLDRAIEGLDYTMYIGPDNDMIGRQAAEEAAKLTERLGHPASILELGADTFASEERSRVFRQAVQAEGCQVRSVVLKNANRDGTEDRLLAEPDILNTCDVIFAYNDAVANGAHLACEKLGKTGIRIIGLDGFEGKENGIDLVKSGKIDATVTCPTGAEQAMTYADMILEKTRDGSMPKKVIMRSTTIDADNVDDFESRKGVGINCKGRKIRLGYVQIDEKAAFRKANTDSILEAAENFDIDLHLVSVGQTLEEQKKQVRAFIQEGMDVIAISPIVQTGWEDVMEEAKKAGIPILLSDRQIDVSDDLYAAYIGSDFEEEGKRCADWLVKAGEGKSSAPSFRILEVEGNKGASPTEGRKLGFEETVKKNKNMQVVATVRGNFDREEGAEAVRQYIAEHGIDFNVLYAHNDDMALGAIEVLKEQGVQPGKDVFVLSVDGTREALKKLQDGDLNCVAECSPLLGDNIMRSVRTIADGRELPFEIITDETVFTADTPDSAFRNRKY